MSQTSDKPSTKKHDIDRFEPLIKGLRRDFSKHFESASEQSTQKITKEVIIIVSITSQRLYLLENQKIIVSYPISSAEKGIGNQSNSYQTPLGIHQISEKIGDNAEPGTIFKSRKDTHTLAKILTSPSSRSNEDNITSRILWLDGLEKGINNGIDRDGINVDSHSRYIYIHGTDEEGHLGQAASHGCIRMANKDVIELFDQVESGNLVLITEL